MLTIITIFLLDMNEANKTIWKTLFIFWKNNMNWTVWKYLNNYPLAIATTAVLIETSVHITSEVIVTAIYVVE